MNVCMLIGNLTRDPELRTTNNGKDVCTFSVAVNRRGGGEDKQADFFTVVAWNKTAELCSKYLVKGRKVGIRGSLQTRSYEDKEGVKRTVTEIIADEVEFLSSRNDGQQDAPYNQPTPAPVRGQGQNMNSGTYAEMQMLEVDEDLPF